MQEFDTEMDINHKRKRCIPREKATNYMIKYIIKYKYKIYNKY